MGNQIIRQPDGNYSVWSTVVNDFILSDFPEKELIAYLSAKAYERERETVTKIINHLRDGRRPYGVFTMTWEDVLKIIEQQHNKQESEQDDDS